MLHRFMHWARGLLCVLGTAGLFRAAADDWVPFDPPPDPLGAGCAFDLRFLNEPVAGEHGFIGTRDGHFVRGGDGEPMRFWGVNGPPARLSGEALRQCARLLARRGVNLVRVHTGYFDAQGAVDPAKVRHAIEVVDALKAEGIYTLFSIYFPLWLKPAPGTPWLRGYDGQQHPFAALFFNRDFQAQYRSWWQALLTTPRPGGGPPLAADPAVAGLEILNEDSFFFWTFAHKNLPEEQWRLLETQFGEWLVQRDGSLERTLARWNGDRLQRDRPEAGRLGFRPLWNMAHEKTARDQDTAAFLFEVQHRFYRETRDFLRQLGFQGVITASNWSTASPEVLGPLEKFSYSPGDFLDRHGYFGCGHKGDSAAWSIREGHTYADRSALRFEAEDPGQPRSFEHPAMDPHYDGRPSMISETTWTRPNRYRSEAPLFYAVFGALQDSDAIVHFALDGAKWTVKPGFFMQPWTLMSPAMMGQFPAAALLYRRGLVRPGEVVARVDLNTNELFQLRGTPLPQAAALDELRLRDVPVADGTPNSTLSRLDPSLHFVGRSEVRFVGTRGQVHVRDLRPFVQHHQRLLLSTTGETRLDYGWGVLKVDAPQAQGVSGNWRAASPVETQDLAFESDLDLGHWLAVAWDGKPIGTSERILLQVMSEEQPSGFATVPVSGSVKRITKLGNDPWTIRALRGVVRFKRADARQLRVVALDANGYPAGDAGSADRIELRPGTLHYLIAR